MAHDIQLHGARQMLEEWKSSHLEEIICIVEKGLREESDTAIDGAKCLIEAVCKTILTERGKDIGRTDSPGTLIRKTTQALEISDEDGGDSMQQMIRGMTSATGGLESLRDSFGPLGHGRDAKHNKLGDWHRLMAVRTAETISVLLYEAHCARTTNLRYTRTEFDEEDPDNKKIDRLADIQVDPDRYEVVINEVYRFRPSQILYDLDREGYMDERARVADSQEAQMDEPT
ncbi:MAG: abortive infection family protein [Steroidobacter sp.]